jgi:hypothetical protein
MRFYAFGSLRFFFLICYLLDSLSGEISCLFAVMRFPYDICCNMHTYLSPKSPPWNASVSIRIFENEFS